MKKYLLFFALTLSIAAQSLSITIPPTPLRPGQSTLATVTFQDSTTPSTMSGVQWVLATPSPISLGAPASSSTSQSLACNGLLCLVYIPSGGVITPGAVATYSVGVSPSAPSGPQTLSLNNIIGADSNGNQIVSIASSPAVITVLSKYDMDGDGKVNSTDTQSVLDQAVGKAACSLGDVNGDGKCNIVDVVIEIRAVNGKIPL